MKQCERGVRTRFPFFFIKINGTKALNNTIECHTTEVIKYIKGGFYHRKTISHVCHKYYQGNQCTEK